MTWFELFYKVAGNLFLTGLGIAFIVMAYFVGVNSAKNKEPAMWMMNLACIPLGLALLYVMCFKVWSSWL